MFIFRLLFFRNQRLLQIQTTKINKEDYCNTQDLLYQQNKDSRYFLQDLVKRL